MGDDGKSGSINSRMAVVDELLKPCPFCGLEAQHNNGGGSTYGRLWWHVGCPKCDVYFYDREVWIKGESKLDPAYPPEECFARWNRRVADEKLVTRRLAKTGKNENLENRGKS